MTRKGTSEKHKKTFKFDSKLRKILLYAIIVGLTTLISISIFIQSYAKKSADHHKRLAEIAAIERENKELAEVNEDLRKQIAYLKTKNGVESVAREKLGLVKDSEIAFVVVKDTKEEKRGVQQNPKNDKRLQNERQSDKDEQKITKEELAQNKEPKNSNWITLIWNDLFGSESDK